MLETSAEEICQCLEQKIESDSLTNWNFFARCTGETMAKNRVELAKRFDLGTVEGVVDLRNKYMELLNNDCDEFKEMFLNDK